MLFIYKGHQVMKIHLKNSDLCALFIFCFILTLGASVNKKPYLTLVVCPELKSGGGDLDLLLFRERHGDVGLSL